MSGESDVHRECRQDIAQLLVENARMRNAIEKALADSESGNGWGPDVTICTYLAAAIGKTYP
jgi:hypothetical protein